MRMEWVGMRMSMQSGSNDISDLLLYSGIKTLTNPDVAIVLLLLLFFIDDINDIIIGDQSPTDTMMILLLCPFVIPGIHAIIIVGRCDMACVLIHWWYSMMIILLLQ